MRFPKRLPFSRCFSMSGVRMSGTCSRKYPAPAWLLTFTPNSRSRSTHCHTMDRDTPTSFAIRAPLITMVAFSASNVSNPASRLSVVPGKDSWVIGSRRTPSRRLSLRSLDAVHKQAEVCGRRRVREHPRRKKVRASLRVSARVLERDPPGDFDHAFRAYSARNFHARRRAFRSHVVQQHRLRPGLESVNQFFLIANLDLHRQRSRADDLRVQPGRIVSTRGPWRWCLW